MVGDSEFQLAMWTPLVTLPIGISSTGQRGNSGKKIDLLTAP